jgi:hypothetical protein
LPKKVALRKIRFLSAQIAKRMVGFGYRNLLPEILAQFHRALGFQQTIRSVAGIID